MKYGNLTDADYEKDTLKIDGEEITIKTATTKIEPQLKSAFTKEDKN
jgi:hypothetical protein